jgi:hypothetical protein
LSQRIGKFYKVNALERRLRMRVVQVAECIAFVNNRRQDHVSPQHSLIAGQSAMSSKHLAIGGNGGKTIVHKDSLGTLDVIIPGMLVLGFLVVALLLMIYRAKGTADFKWLLPLVLLIAMFGFSLGTNGVMFAMIRRINKRVAPDERKPFIGYVVTEVHRQHRQLFPDSQLHKVYWLLLAFSFLGLIATGVVMIAFRM